jgi:excisionase family DNA binding protein
MNIESPWTTEQVAEFLQIHPRTVTRLAIEKDIPAFKIGTHWRFLPSDVDSWMRSRVSSQTELNPVRGN